jgi:hypothetical protein
VGVTVGGWAAIQDAVKKHNLRFIDAYTVDAEFDWKAFVAKFGQPSWEGEGVYEIPNVNEMNLALGQYFIQFRSGS